MAESKKKVNALEDFRKMSVTELTTTIADYRKELVEQHRANKAGELPSAAAIAKTRKSIAKALTILNQKAQETTAAEAKEEEK